MLMMQGNRPQERSMKTKRTNDAPQFVNERESKQAIVVHGWPIDTRTEQRPEARSPIIVQIWSIEKLIPYSRNPRKNDAAVGRMCDSIREFGFKIPCLVRSDGEVVDGHLRLKAARQLGLQEIPVILCDEWTPAQVKAFRLLVNRSATWADWDEELLIAELTDLQAAAFNLNLTGFDSAELDKILLRTDLPAEDTVPPIPEVPVSQRAICGFAVGIGCFAGMPPAPKPSRAFWENASPCCWSPIRRTGSSSIRSGETAPDSTVVAPPNPAI
jgi:hypothetical protein